MKLARTLGGFALVSGTGLAIDFALFAALTAGTAPPFAANLASAGCAVAFVYFASVRRVFRDGPRAASFAAYLVYQAAAIALASLAVAALSRVLPAPLLAKIAVLPATFAANFLFMRALTRHA